jgi:hypothetical protein
MTIAENALTPEQTALVAYIKDRNAKTEAWVAEDPEDRWATLMIEDADHWAGNGVRSIAEYKHYMASAEHYEVYRDVYGIKPRWMDYDSMTLAEIEADLDRLYSALRGQREREEEAERKAEEERVALAKRLGVELDTLKRWMEEAEEF